VREAYEEVKSRLEELKPALRLVADELYAQQELSGARVKEILSNVSADV
jgi:ATP-dependent Zn protease